MTIKEALESAEIEPLDAEILLSSILEKPREYIIAHNDNELSMEELLTWSEFHQRRLDKEPIAYITGTKEFYGKQFLVNSNVLIPRPATEILVDLALDFLHTEKAEVRDSDTGIIAIAVPMGDMTDVQSVVDVGTGSGCIAITIKMQRPDLDVYATDISPEAINIAKLNADKYVVKIYNTEGSLLETLKNMRDPFIVVSNPPYIPEDEKLMKDVVNYEPHLALFSGKDGGDLLRELIHQAIAHPLCKGIVVECKKEHRSLFEKIQRST
ncbi:peptide chain release factor N(5)-glutamine methyltransferase [Candidatus Peregrinibacteria bacterium CG10_big_fil_rev_8_21_14_0_10_42_8]|nr:MAG: peptide chain release factor N(5)-glutamine methyltransferase [Candidatus Peregrinibacteria bacterium CG10_big_fil_rev_8_21_14_0_10_42_8]